MSSSILTSLEGFGTRSDTGWKNLLGRGLDIFHKGSESQCDKGARGEDFRQLVAFRVTYIHKREVSE
ncbi:MAG TPA: MIT C-terminal domain-containing protein [Armatimonadota bacterium]|jgi:ATP-dependent Lon protease|nr:MIT C-terminal domain-containing protein [Armatimonadota bacterium]